MIVQTIETIIDDLKQGTVVAFPTDTVYGLGCDASNFQALAKIYELKQRPLEKPLILFVAQQADVAQYVECIPKLAVALMEQFWPGPLTIVLPKKATVSDAISANLPTIGLRMPNHPDVLAILQRTQLTLATTSANVSGEPAVISAAEVETALGAEIAILNGIAQGAVASTVIEIKSDNSYLVLREGAISVQTIAEIAGHVK